MSRPAQPIPVQRLHAGLYGLPYRYRTEVCAISKSGRGAKPWALRVNYRLIDHFRTLRDARIAAWEPLGLTPDEEKTP